ncbi:MAG: DUF1282 family protein, partial [Bacteroidales bacterium]|nr:DUF1282 family protein [Bacteroidales bacterium]
LIYPVTSWIDISADKKPREELLKDFLLPLSLIVGLFSFLGTTFSAGIPDTFSFAYLVLSGMISFLVIFLEVYLSGWLITKIAHTFNKETNSNDIFNLVIFSHVPFFLTLAVSKLFPSLIFINLLGAYSFFLFWNGIDHFITINKENKQIFMVLSVLVMILTYVLLTWIFNSIYNGILIRFATFGG